MRLAREHNREDAMIEWVFANQPSLTPDLVKQAAREVGQVPDFDARYASTLELVKRDIALGKQFGVRATPTFFIDGLKLDGAPAAAVLPAGDRSLSQMRRAKSSGNEPIDARRRRE